MDADEAQAALKKMEDTHAGDRKRWFKECAVYRKEYEKAVRHRNALADKVFELEEKIRLLSRQGKAVAS